MKRESTLLIVLAALAGCSPGSDDGRGPPGDMSDTRPYSEIADNELIKVAGTEPFWGARVSGDTLTYSTPENQDGSEIAVSRFAGRNGISFTGTFEGAEFALAITPGDCSDGMSDRTYPFVATLQVADETRYGCAWSDEHPFDGPEQP